MESLDFKFLKKLIFTKIIHLLDKNEIGFGKMKLKKKFKRKQKTKPPLFSVFLFLFTNRQHMREITKRPVWMVALLATLVRVCFCILVFYFYFLIIFFCVLFFCYQVFWSETFVISLFDRSLFVYFTPINFY